MILSLVLVVALSTVFPASAPDLQQPDAAVQKAAGAVQWKDPAGDVEPQSTSAGERPGFDLVGLAVTSDGTSVTITATLDGAPMVDFASNVADLYLDTDNDASTGAESYSSKRPGFELRARLSLCIKYANGAEACSGGVGGSTVAGYYSKADLHTLDKSGNATRFYKPFREPTGVVRGAAVSATLPYSDLGVKPGQTIRILAREADGPADASADFPLTLFTLK